MTRRSFLVLKNQDSVIVVGSRPNADGRNQDAARPIKNVPPFGDGAKVAAVDRQGGNQKAEE